MAPIRPRRCGLRPLTMAAALRGSSASRSSSSSSNSSTCARLVPAPVIAVSPSHTLEYDCTDCGSFLFGHRGRPRPRPQTTRTSAHHHSRGSSISEPAQVHNPRHSSFTSHPTSSLFLSILSHSNTRAKEGKIACMMQTPSRFICNQSSMCTVRGQGC